MPCAELGAISLEMLRVESRHAILRGHVPRVQWDANLGTDHGSRVAQRIGSEDRQHAHPLRSEPMRAVDDPAGGKDGYDRAAATDLVTQIVDHAAHVGEGVQPTGAAPLRRLMPSSHLAPCLLPAAVPVRLVGVAAELDVAVLATPYPEHPIPDDVLSDADRVGGIHDRHVGSSWRWSWVPRQQAHRAHDAQSAAAAVGRNPARPTGAHLHAQAPHATFYALDSASTFHVGE
jgi:hypothetical protein